MARPDAIRVQGTVVEVRPDGVCRVELANGHRVVAWGAARAGAHRLAPGSRLTLEMSPCDLSKGRVVAEKSN
jgi:translation initiation factor IF-1